VTGGTGRVPRPGRVDMKRPIPSPDVNGRPSAAARDPPDCPGTWLLRWPPCATLNRVIRVRQLHNRLPPDARNCRIADVAIWHNYALPRIYLTETITGSALVL